MRAPTYQNLPQRIGQALRESILDGELPPGSRLKQVDIAARFDTSLIPVREALRTLEQEGLVTIYPNKGAMVSALSIREIREIFDTRIILESGALRLALPALAPDDIAQANRLIARLDTAVHGRDLSRFNQRLHTTLYRRCDNSCLLELIATLHRNVERYMRLYLLDDYNNELSQKFHRRIVEAAAAGDFQLASQHLTTHMEQARDRLVAALAAS
ncbi:MAG: GntR family transcriptional regulator [Desulfopila sp.]